MTTHPTPTHALTTTEQLRRELAAARLEADAQRARGDALTIQLAALRADQATEVTR